METSASSLSKTTIMNNKLPSIVSNKRFILLGCTSELGPAKSLLQIPGATVLGIARGGERLDNLLDYVNCHSPDDTTFMYPKGGADLLQNGPQIVQWILDNTSKEDTLVVCPLGKYLASCVCFFMVASVCTSMMILIPPFCVSLSSYSYT